jgi:hypothetical protein
MIVAVPTGSALAQKKRLGWQDFHEQSMVRSSLSEDIFYQPFLDRCEQAGSLSNVPRRPWPRSTGRFFPEAYR